MSILDAAAEVADFIESEGIPYAIIGGLAVQHWSESRTTRDIDLVVMIPPDKLEGFLNAAVRRFRARVSDAVSFAMESRVLLLSASDGTPVDVALGIPGYEEQALGRAAPVSLPGGRHVRVISAEDLIIHKCIAGRPRDIEDVERILVRQHLAVDLDYIRQWLDEFRPIIEDHDVLDVFEQSLDKAREELRES